MGVVKHLPFGVMANDGCPAQAFEYADLDFLGGQGDETIEASGKALERFARKTSDEVGVYVDSGLVAQKMEVFLEALIILAAVDELADCFVESLDADLELQGGGREFRNDFTQCVWQAIGDHFEVKEMTGLIPFEKEFKNGFADGDVQIESAIDEFEMFDATVEKALQGLEQAREGNLTDWNVQRREAKLA